MAPEENANQTIGLTLNLGFKECDCKHWKAASESGLPRLPPTNVSMPKWLSIYLQMSKRILIDRMWNSTLQPDKFMI